MDKISQNESQTTEHNKKSYVTQRLLASNRLRDCLDVYINNSRSKSRFKSSPSQWCKLLKEIIQENLIFIFLGLKLFSPRKKIIESLFLSYN